MKTEEIEWGDFGIWITCPCCGEIDYECTEYPSGLQHDGDVADHDCAECGAVFRVLLSVSYEYSTGIVTPPDEQKEDAR